MNCAVCGSPLPFGRAVFHCSCGVFIHAYCWEQHVLQAHQPAFETGTTDLNGEFRVSEVETVQVTETEKASEAEQVSEIEQVPEIEQASEAEQSSKIEQASEAEQVSGEQITSPDE
ncbi:MAG: hypothetical protein KAW00_02055 [Dehalococcoidia bacterium]|nr:hypothetical protein [Dehalococcoidia bacterium]